MDRIEYTRRELTTKTTPSDLDALGREGWELCGIHGGVGWFRRSAFQRECDELAERQLAGSK